MYASKQIFSNLIERKKKIYLIYIKVVKIQIEEP